MGRVIFAVGFLSLLSAARADDFGSRFIMRIRPELAGKVKEQSAGIHRKLAKAPDASAKFLPLLKKLSSDRSTNSALWRDIQDYRGPRFFLEYPHQMDSALKKGTVLKSAAILSEVEKTLPSVNSPQSGYLIRLVGDFDDPASARILKGLLADKDATKRGDALLELALSNSPGTYEKDFRTAWEDKDTKVRGVATMGLILTRSLDFLLPKVTCDFDDRVQQNMLFSAGYLPPKDITAPVMRRLASTCATPDAGYRVIRNSFAVSALMLRDPVTFEILADLTADPDAKTKGFTQGFLKTMFYDGPDNPVAWKDYFKKKKIY